MMSVLQFYDTFDVGQSHSVRTHPCHVVNPKAHQLHPIQQLYFIHYLKFIHNYKGGAGFLEKKWFTVLFFGNYNYDNS